MLFRTVAALALLAVLAQAMTRDERQKNFEMLLERKRGRKPVVGSGSHSGSGSHHSGSGSHHSGSGHSGSGPTTKPPTLPPGPTQPPGTPIVAMVACTTSNCGAGSCSTVAEYPQGSCTMSPHGNHAVKATCAVVSGARCANLGVYGGNGCQSLIATRPYVCDRCMNNPFGPGSIKLSNCGTNNVTMKFNCTNQCSSCSNTYYFSPSTCTQIVGVDGNGFQLSSTMSCQHQILVRDYSDPNTCQQATGPLHVYPSNKCLGMDKMSMMYNCTTAAENELH